MIKQKKGIFNSNPLCYTLWLEKTNSYTFASGGPYCNCGDRKKEDRAVIKTTLKIEGMMCPMCEAHISGVIRKVVPGAKKVSVSRGRGEASFPTEEEADGDRLKEAIAATGYDCLSVEAERCEKKGWFGRK